MKALGVASELLPEEVVDTRKEFLTRITQASIIEYGGESWTLREGLWIKKLSLNYLSRGKPREGIRN